MDKLQRQLLAKQRIDAFVAQLISDGAPSPVVALTDRVFRKYAECLIDFEFNKEEPGIIADSTIDMISFLLGDLAGLFRRDQDPEKLVAFYMTSLNELTKRLNNNVNMQFNENNEVVPAREVPTSGTQH